MHRWLNSVFYFANVAWTPLTNGPCSLSSWERSLTQSQSPAWDSEHYTRAWRPPAARRACWDTCSMSSPCLSADTLHLLLACCCCASAPGLSSASWLAFLSHLLYLKLCVCVSHSKVVLLHLFCSCTKGFETGLGKWFLLEESRNRSPLGRHDMVQYIIVQLHWYKLG